MLDAQASKEWKIPKVSKFLVAEAGPSGNVVALGL